jgi:hypothetical protein
MEIHAKTVRAVITRDVLDTLCGICSRPSDSMLDLFGQHRKFIEQAVVDQFLRTRKEPLVVQAPKGAT